jgi:hypothetical protein
VRCAKACDLFAYYGRAAIELTRTEVWIWGLLTGELSIGRKRNIEPGAREFVNEDAERPAL